MKMSKLAVARLILAACFLLQMGLGVAGQALAQAGPPSVLLLDVDGIINPVKERLISRALRQARQQDAELLVIRLDTPGGLLDSTREIVELLLESEVPTAVYVAPRGAQAGSAGTFITAAANFAVLAPGTNIGAATPVSATGEDLGETLANKATNDAAALMRSIAQERGRNEAELEATVREAVSFSAQEAVELGVVDFIATDLEDLLSQLDGREAQTAFGSRTLDTADASIQNIDKNLLEHFLEFISNPNVSFLLITVGGLGIVVELFNPGLIVPGVVGIICLLLGFVALGNLPVNWAAVAFILLAIALAVLEIQVSGFGVLGVGAIVSFVVGGLLLFNQFGGGSPTLPSVEVSRWLLAGVAGVFAVSLLYLMGEIYLSRRRRPAGAGQIDIIGQTGTVTNDLDPEGVVRIGNETWTAISIDDTVIPAGEKVVVTGVSELILTVARAGPGGV